MSDVVLIYPPVVPECIGEYYPSIAVLAGSLDQHGHSVRQLDLNMALADWLASSPDRLLAMCDSSSTNADDSPDAILMASWSEVARRQSERPLKLDQSQPDGVRLRRAMLSQLVPFVSSGLELASSVISGLERFMQSELALDRSIFHCASLLGISVAMGPQLGTSLVLARILKREFPAMRLVLGGPVISLLGFDKGRDLLDQFWEVDALVRWEGEAALATLAEQSRDGNWAPQAVGVAQSRDDFVLKRQNARTRSPLSDLPPPQYDSAILLRSRTRSLSVLVTRGCYWGRCDYCDFVELYAGSGYEGRRPERVLDEIDDLRQSTGISHFSLITESIPPSFARKFSALAISRGASFTWESFVMADARFDPPLLRMMKDSGCSSLTLGLETMDRSALRRLHKQATDDTNRAFLDSCAEAGVKVHVNLIPDLPGMTYRQSLSALNEFEVAVQGNASIASVTVFPFEATLSSAVGRHPGDYGLLPARSSRPDQQAQFPLNSAPLVDPAMTDAERQDAVGKYRSFAAALNAGVRERDQREPGNRLFIDRMSVRVLRASGTYVCNLADRSVYRMSEPADQAWCALARGIGLTVEQLAETLGVDRATAQSIALGLAAAGLVGSE